MTQMYIADAGQPNAAPVAPLSESVDSGQVTLQPEAGEQLCKVLVEQLHQVDAWLAQMNTLTQRAPLGANPVGDAMAVKFETRAHGDPMSFDSVMTAYRDVLQQTVDAVTKAVHALQVVDTDYRAEFTDLGDS